MFFFKRLKILFKKDNALKIGTFGIINNPEYRQEPWRESIRHRLDFFDVVCLVCGNKDDINMLNEYFAKEVDNNKLILLYKNWPFPEWSYEELPKHLNEALILVKKQKCDWAVKLDIDTVFHEKDNKKFRFAINKAEILGKWMVSFSKLQFFLPERCWIKGSLPIAINLKKPVCYGFDTDKYTDLCQPIQWDGLTKLVYNGIEYSIPVGNSIKNSYILKSRRIKLFNYDFTFRTFERSIELLYQIEMAHSRFWGKGYSGLEIGDITRDSSMKDFLNLSKDRFLKMNKNMKISEHPKHFQDSLRTLKKGQWGFDLWGKIYYIR